MKSTNIKICNIQICFLLLLIFLCNITYAADPITDRGFELSKTTSADGLSIPSDIFLPDEGEFRGIISDPVGIEQFAFGIAYSSANGNPADMIKSEYSYIENMPEGCTEIDLSNYSIDQTKVKQPGIYNFVIVVKNREGKYWNSKQYKVNIVSDTDGTIRLESALKDTLKELENAYKNKNRTAFMQKVSVDFQGDSFMLERAVLKDFLNFRITDLQFTIQNIAAKKKSNGVVKEITASVRYQRSVISNRSGQSLSDSGLTEFTFIKEPGGLRLYAMKLPLIFGLSDSTVATGEVRSVENKDVIVVTAQGNVIKTSDPQSVASSSSMVYQIYQNVHGINDRGAYFSAASGNYSMVDKTTADLLASCWGYDGQVNIPQGAFYFANGSSWEPMNQSFSTIHELPINPRYSAGTTGWPIQVGGVVAIKLANGRGYVLLKVASKIQTGDGPKYTCQFKVRGGNTGF